MANKRATRGSDAQFTYDFGIAIAQGTVDKIKRLTGATLTLASAFYALKTTANQYVDILRENTLRFGGVLSTMKAMEQAQNRLIKGQSYFKVDDQLKGINKLMAVSVNVGKNFELINKSAHALGMSYSEFSGAIASAIQGNASALVDAGLMTQRATRMFDKYQANTVMRQQAILNFVKNHKGLMRAVKNDFETVQDQMLRIKATWSTFLKSIVGKPNDPNSFYGQVVSATREVAEAFSKNAELLKRAGFIVGQTLGWVIRQIGHFVVWVGKKFKKATDFMWKATEDYQEKTRSMLVWLEFWKLKVVDFFKEYGGAIKTVLKLLLAYKALKWVFVIGSAAIKSVLAYKAALKATWLLQKAYMASMGPFIGTTAKFFQSLAVWLPRPFRRAWVFMGKFFADFLINMKILGASILKFLLAPFKWLKSGVMFLFKFIGKLPALIMASFKALRALWVSLNATNPIGWIILAITLITTLYVKSESFRKLVNAIFKALFEHTKLLWNSLAYLITGLFVGLKKAWIWFNKYIWNPVAGFFKNAVNWIGQMWDKFKDTTVGKWLDKWIVQPLKKLFSWIADVWGVITRGLGKLTNWLGGANNSISDATKEMAEKNGVWAVPTIGGRAYQSDDSTNYLNPANWGSGSDSSDKDTPNPIIAGAGQNLSGGGTTYNNGGNLTFNDGAIKIIVQNGEKINETELANKVRDVIRNLERENNMRGGTA